MSTGKVLLIAPVFFDYYKAIISSMEKMGYEVTYWCDAPSNSNWSKAVGRLNKRLILQRTKRYFASKQSEIENEIFQYVVVIGGMTFAFTPEMVSQLRSTQKTAKFVLYQWDSEKNLPYCKRIHQQFDCIYTFDRMDANRDRRYRFLPLFYTDMYRKIGEEKQENEWDCVYVGTAHPQKYRDINKMSAVLKEIDARQFIYHYMPSKLKFWYQKLTSPEFRFAKQKELEWTKLDHQEMMRIISRTKCILDAPQKGQTGLTIRTLECLGAKKKLITTNDDVRHYDFYNPNNILIFDAQRIIDRSFLEGEYEELPDDIYQKYSIDHWITTILTGV